MSSENSRSDLPSRVPPEFARMNTSTTSSSVYSSGRSIESSSWYAIDSSVLNVFSTRARFSCTRSSSFSDGGVGNLPINSTASRENSRSDLTRSLNRNHGGRAFPGSKNLNLYRVSSGSRTSPLRTLKYNSLPP